MVLAYDTANSCLSSDMVLSGWLFLKSSVPLSRLSICRLGNLFLTSRSYERFRSLGNARNVEGRAAGAKLSVETIATHYRTPNLSIVCLTFVTFFVYCVGHAQIEPNLNFSKNLDGRNLNVNCLDIPKASKNKGSKFL